MRRKSEKRLVWDRLYLNSTPGVGVDSLQKAKVYAFLLLKFRLRSEKEMRIRLLKKKFSQPVIKEVISFLKDKGFINDSYFTSVWIESRLKKLYGLKRIQLELRQKGVEKDIIACQINELKKDYSEEEAAKNLAAARFKRLQNIAPEIAKRRVFAYLARRGYPFEVISGIISKIKDEG